MNIKKITIWKNAFDLWEINMYDEEGELIITICSKIRPKVRVSR